MLFFIKKPKLISMIPRNISTLSNKRKPTSPTSDLSDTTTIDIDDYDDFDLENVSKIKCYYESIPDIRVSARLENKKINETNQIEMLKKNSIIKKPKNKYLLENVKDKR